MRWLSKEKWRPRLATVVVAILIVVMALPLVGLFFFRLYENQLIRQTEGELIAQGAVIAAVYADAVRAAGIAPERLGTPISADPARDNNYPYQPIEPQLDLASDNVMPSRPAAVPAPAYASELRLRIPDQPPPPLYSVSRGTKVRVFVALPVELDGRVAGVVYMSRTPNNIVKHLYGERGKVTLAAIAILGGTLLIALVFIRTVSRPIYALIERTKRIAAGDREAMRPLAHHGTREMAALSAAFLDMAQKLQARSDSIQTFATHVSHELKSPLTAIQGAAELLRDSGGTMDEDERRRFSNNIVTDAGRLNLLVRRLLELARAENLAPSGESTTIGAALALLPVDARLEVRVESGSDIGLGISGENLAIVLANLIDNSARHGAKQVTVGAEKAGERVALHVGDDGGGISAANR
ncbi:histidine kinase dimerization/phospho-acceptor domain-containing protein, partial [Mesorhizobium sp.]|uniref:histidine kinase dimerization/phospho-acceptor domain-containing protein n=1 Tax=Mesorhizobium sp. TaxID=1871066 RepID=UPI0025F54B0F